jgi:sec-independent protein translocase protein TatC
MVSLPLTRTRKVRHSSGHMTLAGHLGELRRRIIVCVCVLVVASVIAIIAYEPILHFLIRPLCQASGSHLRRNGIGHSPLLPAGGSCSTLYVTSPLDGLSLRFKITVFGGLVMASPVILFQVWRFVTPGLAARERRYAIPFVIAAFSLFMLGAATAYVVLPHALSWLRSVGGPDLQNIYDPIPYLGLVLALMALFGITFQFPVVLVSLELANVVTPARLLQSWRWAVILIVVVSAVFTPSSDPFSLLALAIPLIVFYFASIGIGKVMGR